jgi:putative ABC transport system permease protein
MAIGLAGGALGMALTFPIVAGMSEQLSSFFPVFVVSPETLILAFGFAILVGLVASVFPIYRALTTSIVQGLRQIG